MRKASFCNTSILFLGMTLCVVSQAALGFCFDWSSLEGRHEAESELAWLREAVYEGTWGYLPPGGTPQRRVSAFERWRTDPSDLAHPASVVAGAVGPGAA